MSLNDKTQLQEVTRLIEDGQKLTGRECGECSMCCKVLKIDIPELRKPSGTWCQHCRPGKGGCGIHETRPDICRGFACVWLVSPGLGEEWKPSRSKIVIAYERNETRVDCHFVVDPAVPSRWREAPYYDTIKLFAFNGLNSVSGVYSQTYVTIKRQSILILPRKEIDVTDLAHAVLNVGDESEWDVKCFESSEDCRRFASNMTQARAAFMTLPRHEQEQVRVARRTDGTRRNPGSPPAGRALRSRHG